MFDVMWLVRVTVLLFELFSLLGVISGKC